MSQTNQLVSKAIELQRNTLENSQRAMEQAVEVPLQQTVALQRNVAQMMLNGLEISDWMGTQGVELTRNALDTYLDTVESAARDTSELTEQGMQGATSLGQQSLDTGQQFASAVSGDGAMAGQPPAQSQGQPPQTQGQTPQPQAQPPQPQAQPSQPQTQPPQSQGQPPQPQAQPPQPQDQPPQPQTQPHPSQPQAQPPQPQAQPPQQPIPQGPFPQAPPQPQIQGQELPQPPQSQQQAHHPRQLSAPPIQGAQTGQPPTQSPGNGQYRPADAQRPTPPIRQEVGSEQAPSQSRADSQRPAAQVTGVGESESTAAETPTENS
ncbi:hypothetical protein [Halosimplex salinum]|uniref:hypothetical protein n=1 Tax=Halosimplex salinum TaxID=1710538 RepID=UPI000F48C873|nr:hypothetical protein [Halosimplex salinum]